MNRYVFRIQDGSNGTWLVGFDAPSDPEALRRAGTTCGEYAAEARGEYVTVETYRDPTQGSGFGAFLGTIVMNDECQGEVSVP